MWIPPIVKNQTPVVRKRREAGIVHEKGEVPDAHEKSEADIYEEVNGELIEREHDYIYQRPKPQQKPQSD